MYKITTTVGAAIRRPIRRQLQQMNGVTFTEDKGLLDSFFVIKTRNETTHRAIMLWLKRISQT